MHIKLIGNLVLSFCLIFVLMINASYSLTIRDSLLPGSVAFHDVSVATADTTRVDQSIDSSDVYPVVGAIYRANTWIEADELDDQAELELEQTQSFISDDWIVIFNDTSTLWYHVETGNVEGRTHFETEIE
ncbi:hypothetical protein K8I28_10715 [bacterium]|nr:hypothetical protein [bacterium]